MFTLKDIKIAIKGTRATTPGEDGISVIILKSLSDDHLGSLLGIYNNIFCTGDLPQTWKTATIIPVRKPGKPAHLVASYRPIALTPVLCKVFERMLLRRLLAWGGQHNIFYQDQFGFLPAKDTTIALATFLNDIHTARRQRRFSAAVCLDVKAAYDSVCPELLVHKIASLGAGGRFGRWISAFVHHRRLCIRWKSFTTTTAPWQHGVPQGSVLSPLLFILYLKGIEETLDAGVYLLIYADDILVYAIEDDEERARRKLENTLENIVKWCQAHELNIEPSKCAAINFSRRRDPGPPLRIRGSDIPWSSPVKILGIWFTRTLCFTPHFNNVKIKLTKRINYIKAIASRSRGVTSAHMIRIINSLVRSSIEYGAPLFYDSPPTAIKKLEVIYNSAIRLATGLPSWTPLPVLRQEAGVASISSRLHLITKLFLVRLLSANIDLRLGVAARHQLSCPDPGWKWWSPLQEISLSCGPLANTTRLHWPPSPGQLHFEVTVSGLPFQDTALPEAAVYQAWSSWVSALPLCNIFATDASKNDSKTSVGVLDVASGLSIAGLVPHINSVFSAEAIAIQLALSSLPASHSEIIILSDSLSVLTALEEWSFKSHSLILLLLNTISQLNSRGFRVHFVWCPGHRGIPPNEKVDAVARNGPFSRTLFWIAPEDIRHRIKKDWKVEIYYMWINCEYANSYSHLLSDRLYPHWVSSRKEDVTIARWRSRTTLTCQRLHRMNMTFTPLCNFCYDLDTPDHRLLYCPRLTQPRSSLLNFLKLPSPVSFSDILRAATSSPRALHRFLIFSSASEH